MSTLDGWDKVIRKMFDEDQRKKAEFQAHVDRYGDLLQLTAAEPVFAVHALVQYFDKEIEEMREREGMSLLRMKYLLLRQQCIALEQSMETTL